MSGTVSGTRVRAILFACFVAAYELIVAHTCAAQARGAPPRVQDFKAISVDARLDIEGTMHVEETHEFSFTGDWNGGEREIKTPSRLSAFRLMSLTRVDSKSGQRFALRSGDLSAVDEYAVDERNGSTLVRWRSRLPSAPPFDRTAFVYVISYRIYGVLSRLGDGSFWLSHEFVPQRQGTLADMRIRFAIDPAWQMHETLPDELHLHDVAPTATHLVQATLRPDTPLAPRFRSLLLAYALALAGLTAVWIWAERRRGRLGSVPTLRDEDARACLDANLLPYPAEEIAVTWSAMVGGPEPVAALLARLELGRKIATHVDDKNELVLELLVDRRTLKGYERELITALFFDGDQTTTTNIRKHYGRFSPVQEIKPHLSAMLEERLGPFRPLLSMRRLPELALMLAGLSTPLFAVTDPLNLILLPGLSVMLLFFGHGHILRWRANPHWGLAEARWLAFFAGFLAIPAVALIVAGAHIHRAAVIETSLGALLFAFGHSKLVLGLASSHESRRGSKRRLRLKVIRQYLKTKLEAKASLPDAIVPYLFALGLTPEAYVWFGAKSQDRDNYGSRVSGSGEAGESYAGGGGSFGGAGASGSWVSAVGGLALGTGEASAGWNSGSSSSSGGSSSSSGGGSVGGW